MATYENFLAMTAKKKALIAKEQAATAAQAPVQQRQQAPVQQAPVQQAPAQEAAPQNALHGDFLDVFGAVRNKRAAPYEREALRLGNEAARNREVRAAADEGRAAAAEGRAADTHDNTQTEFDTERATATTLGALGAYSNMVDSIDSSEIAAEARPQAYAAAFDRIAPALQAAGHDPEKIVALRDDLIANPQSAADILAGLRGNSGSQANLQAAYGPDGNAVFVNPRTGRVAARGYAPASAAIGQGRLAVAQENAQTSQGNLGERRRDNDPNHIFDERAAGSEGAAAGTGAQNLPSARAAVGRSIETVDRLLSTDPTALQSVLGVPSIQGIFRGGAGRFGTIPGTPSANVAADIEQTVSQARLAAYESLKGAGALTEAESLFGAQATTNLTRARTYTGFTQELGRFRQNLVQADRIIQLRAAPSRNPNRRTAEAAPSSAPAVDIDEILRRNGAH